MPRRAKGARLQFIDRSKSGRASYYEVRDTGGVRFSTGTDSREEAEEALAAYIEQKSRPCGPTRAEDLTVGHVLTLYAEEHGASVADPVRLSYAIEALAPFWSGLTVSEVMGNTCRRYCKHRGVSDGTLRRELGTLQAALNHCAKEGHLIGHSPEVWRPKPPAARDRWLTRQEAAWLLRAARSLRRDGRHLADFIHHSLYTGSRKATVLAMHIDTPSVVGGHVDTVNGILYRKPQGKRATTKRQNPARLPARYLAHVRRMKANGRRYIVERQVVIGGEMQRGMVRDVKKAWGHAKELAEKMAKEREITLDLSDVTIHSLKHTAITWALQRGASSWDAAGYFSTSHATIERVYGHHSPDHQQSAVDAMDRRA